MWLYVPYPSAPDSEAWTSDLSSLSELCGRSLTWNGKSRQPAFWQRALQTDSLLPLQFGAISQDSMESRWQEWLTSFAEDSHARTSASPAGERESWKATEAGSGSSSLELFASVDRGLWQSRTSQQSLFEESTPFSGTWPRSGMTRNGSAYARPTWAPAIAGNDGSVWPTVKARDHHAESLADDVTMWRTPSAGHPDKGGAQDPEKRAAGGHTLDLQDQVSTWATPSARDWKSGDASDETYEKNARPLNEQACRFLPQDQATPSGPICWCGIQNCDQPSHKRRLNPFFVEWLMGIPIGWCQADAPLLYGRSAMDAYLCRSRRRLSSLRGD